MRKLFKLEVIEHKSVKCVGFDLCVSFVTDGQPNQAKAILIMAGARNWEVARKLRELADAIAITEPFSP